MNVEHYAAVLKGSEGIRELRESLSSEEFLDLSEADLRKLDLSNSDLSGADLSRADCREVILDGASLSEANLDHADFRGSSLRSIQADLGTARNTDLREAILDFAVFSMEVNQNTRFSGASFRHAELSDAVKLQSLWLARSLPVRVVDVLIGIIGLIIAYGQYEIATSQVEISSDQAEIALRQLQTTGLPIADSWGEELRSAIDDDSPLKIKTAIRRLGLLSRALQASRGSLPTTNNEKSYLFRFAQVLGTEMQESEKAAVVKKLRSEGRDWDDPSFFVLQPDDDPVKSLNRVKSGKTLFKDTDFSGVYLFLDDARGFYFYGTQFDGASLRECDFRYSTLYGTDFSGSDCRGARFDGALFGTRESRGKVSVTSFRDADIRGADFRGAKGLETVDFQGARWDSSTKGLEGLGL